MLSDISHPSMVTDRPLANAEQGPLMYIVDDVTNTARPLTSNFHVSHEPVSLLISPLN